MRTGAARGHVGQFHEAAFYGSDAEFRGLMVPFAEEGIPAGETVIGYDDRKNRLLQTWLTDPSAVTFIGDQSLYATSAGRSRPTGGSFEFHVAMDAGKSGLPGACPSGEAGAVRGRDRYE
jgi:hypothetical protein